MKCLYWIHFLQYFENEEKKYILHIIFIKMKKEKIKMSDIINHIQKKCILKEQKFDSYKFLPYLQRINILSIILAKFKYLTDE